MGIDVAAYPTDIANCLPNRPYLSCRVGQILGARPRFYVVWMTFGAWQPGHLGYGREISRRAVLLRLRD
jgi:hypothetical protein